jgi:hypothetical protein
MATDFVGNMHKAIQNMNIDKMSSFFGDELDLCCYENKEYKPCPVIGGCSRCWKDFLSQGVNTYVPGTSKRSEDNNTPRSVGRNKTQRRLY